MNRRKIVGFVNPHLFLICLHFVEWQWLDEHAAWYAYDATVSRKIEELYSAGAGGSVEVEICGRNYEIDVDSMQQINKDTKVTKKIQRCARSLATEEASLPTATASTSASLEPSTSSSSSKKSNRKSKKGTWVDKIKLYYNT